MRRKRVFRWPIIFTAMALVTALVLVGCGGAAEEAAPAQQPASAPAAAQQQAPTEAPAAAPQQQQPAAATATVAPPPATSAPTRPSFVGNHTRGATPTHRRGSGR